jgi:glycosyltransferase involved in cell wall biosynthesis
LNEPLVSVGLQFFNNEATLRQAIQSIFNQSYQNWELILHDDGSQDRSLEIASSFRDPRIRLFHDGVNRKRPIRINESLRLVKGKYYALMDGDDISYPDRLLRQVEYLEEHPSVDLLGTGMIVFDGTGKPIGKRQPPTKHEDICARPWGGFPMAQPTFMGRTDWFKRFSYDIRALGMVEDQDLLLRAYRYSRFNNLSNILLGYREVNLYLKKIIVARFFLSQSLIRQFRRERKWSLGVQAVAAQFIKALVDCIAVTAGLKYRILRHRAWPITNEEEQDWIRVWKSVNH